MKKVTNGDIVYGSGLFEELEHVCTSAETYVEQRLYELCSVNERKKQIYYEWQTNKQKFVKQTQTIVYDFQHYSLHDQSHSRSIVESIEMFLGKERVNKLGIGDLWLLLNCAYSHDIGMAMRHEETLAMWRSDADFHRYVEKEVNDMESNAQEALQYYWQLCNIISADDQMKGIEKNRERILKFESDWPVYIRKYVSVITGEYIRKKHAERSKEYLEKFLGRYQDFLGTNVAENRLYQLMGKIAYAHAKDLSYILSDLEYEANGFGNEKLHPQFIAAMLCLGDLLDMDNNRFDPYAIRYFGELPAISEIHLKKHLSITHLRITEHEVEARAESKNVSVCCEAQKWFSQLEETLNWITSHWNSIVPVEMGGCTFRKHELYVSLDGEWYNGSMDKTFRVDKYKLIDLIIGEHLYSSKWVWIREYLQNAMDATKVMLWIRAKEGTERIFEGEEFVLEKASPMQLNINRLEEYAVEFTMEFISPKQCKGEEDYVRQIPQEEMIRFQILDRGIGLEKESLDVITTIGTGWRGRERYQLEMQEILKWLRPTGGFGIGLQAGFMVADEVEITTKGLRDTKGYKVILKSPRIGGSISTVTNREMKYEGTVISMMIPVRNIHVLIDSDTGKAISVYGNSGYFSYEDLCSNLYRKLQDYIREIIPNNIIPIRMKLVNGEETKIEMLHGKLSPALRKENFTLYQNRFQIQYDTVYDNVEKDLIEDLDFLCLWVWDTQNQLSMQLVLHKAENSQMENEVITMSTLSSMKNECNHISCFKNVKVRESISNKGTWIPYISTLIDFMGMRAEGCLKVNRDKFNENFDEMSYVSEMTHVCVNYFIMEYINNRIKKDIFSQVAFRYLILWDALTNVENNYRYSERIRNELKNYYLLGKRFNRTGTEYTCDEESINIDYGWLYELFLKKEKLVVFEISSEFSCTEEVSFKNLEPGGGNDLWERDDVAQYIFDGGKVLSSVILYKLFEENLDLNIEKVKICELRKTFYYISSWDNYRRKRNRSSFDDAVKKTVQNKETKIEFKREEQRYQDLIMRKSLSYVSDAELDWENQNIILLPFHNNDYYMLPLYAVGSKQKECSKSTFIQKIKQNLTWKRAVDYVLLQQNGILRKSREMIEEEYEELCVLIYDISVELTKDTL